MLDTGWRSKADRPFVPTRVIVEVESEDETQLPKDQPLWKDNTMDKIDEEDDGRDEDNKLRVGNERDFVPVSAMLLDERISEDEDEVQWKFFCKEKTRIRQALRQQPVRMMKTMYLFRNF